MRKRERESLPTFHARFFPFPEIPVAPYNTLSINKPIYSLSFFSHFFFLHATKNTSRFFSFSLSYTPPASSAVRFTQWWPIASPSPISPSPELSLAALSPLVSPRYFKKFIIKIKNHSLFINIKLYLDF